MNSDGTRQDSEHSPNHRRNFLDRLAVQVGRTSGARSFEPRGPRQLRSDGPVGIRLNIATAVISAMAVGISTDCAIYLIYRLREELARTQMNQTVARCAHNGEQGNALRRFHHRRRLCGPSPLLGFLYTYLVWLSDRDRDDRECALPLILLPSLILTFRPRFIFGKTASG